MPERRIRPRRPIAWNRLLSKGHVHLPSESRQRHAVRQSMEDEAADYLCDRAQQVGPPQVEAQDDSGDASNYR